MSVVLPRTGGSNWPLIRSILVPRRTTAAAANDENESFVLVTNCLFGTIEEKTKLRQSMTQQFFDARKASQRDGFMLSSTPVDLFQNEAN